MGIFDISKDYRACPLTIGNFRAPCTKDQCEWYINSNCVIRIIAEELMEIKKEIKRNQSPDQEDTNILPIPIVQTSDIPDDEPEYNGRW